MLDLAKGPTERPLSILRDAGFVPGAIIDIGVASGTPGLYDVWGPQVPVMLIEPSANARPYMKRIRRDRGRVAIFNVGASDHEGVMPATEEASRPYLALGNVKPKWAPVEVPVRRCDDIMREAELPGPYVYKLDTDTHDWQALQGSEWTLEQTGVVIVEMNVFAQLRGFASPDRIWRFLTDRGFVFFDIGSAGHGENGALRCVDFIFVRESLPVFAEAFAHAMKR